MVPSRHLATPMVLALLLVACVVAHEGHHDEGSGDCDEEHPRLVAAYAPGLITLDGSDADWAEVPGAAFQMRAATGEFEKPVYPVGDGSVTLKAAHDGRDIFFLLKAPGPFVYDPSSNMRNPSMSLMFQIGSQATFYAMGGCMVGGGQCNAQTCPGREVDIMHYEIRTAVPGRVYGANPLDNALFSGADRFGSLKDMYAYSPHCLELDGPVATPDFNSSSPYWGAGGSQNDWSGAWSHTSLPPAGAGGLTAAQQPYGQAGADGQYVMEFRRPLVTTDRLQQDAQFRIGAEHHFSAGVWYPVNGQPWKHHEHYVPHCDWIDLVILPGNSGGRQGSSPGTALSATALVFSFGAIGAAGYLLYVMRSKPSGFNQMTEL